MYKKITNKKNAIYSILDTLFLPLFMLIVTPIFIKYLGIEQYGMWTLINSLIVAMSILNIGGVDTVIKYISYYRGINNYISINEIFSTVFITQLVFAFVIVFISFYLPNILIDGNLFNVDEDYKIIFIGALQFGILLFSIKLIEQIIFAYFKGFERFDISSKLSIFSKFMMILVQLVTVLNDGNIYDNFRNSFLFLSLLLVFEIIFIKVKNKEINFLTNFKIIRIKEIFHFTKWSWVISIVGTASGQVDRLVVASLANMTLLGYYSLALLVFKNLHSILASSMAWVFPKISRENSSEKTYQYYLLLQGLIFIISVTISSFLIIFDNVFLFWLKEDIFFNSINYIKSLLLLLPLYSLSIIPFYIVKGTGNIKYNFYSDSMTFVIRIILMLVLYKFYGINGIIIAIAFSGLFLLSYLTVIVKKKVLYEYNLKIINIILLPLIYITMMLVKIIFIKFLLIIIIIILYYSIFNKVFMEYKMKRGIL
jgi:O-antigen/teichoic acid export membrane protein